MTIRLREEDIDYAKISIIDDAGRVFFYNDRVFRAILSDEAVDLFREILESPWIDSLFLNGLVRTWVCRDVEISGVPLILEHQKYPVFLQPSEYSSIMFWQAAKSAVAVNKELSRYGYGLKDAHPWNIMWFRGIPFHVDFGSIIKTETVSTQWYDLFQKYFAIPVWLSHTKKWKRFSREYRRENTFGFGLELFNTRILKYVATGLLNALTKYSHQPDRFFNELDHWLDRHKPCSAAKEYWAVYNQNHDVENPLLPKTAKHQFVYRVLEEERPKSVLDCASNKGFYSEMAARLGASVSAFDREEYCVDVCVDLAKKEALDITPALMDFRFPTPGYGFALRGETAFERFKSDIVLALGLVHHVCIDQGYPVSLFCETIEKYATKGVIFEFVDPADKYVASWNKKIPGDYCLDQFLNLFSRTFSNVEKQQLFNEDGVLRTFLYLRK